MNPTTQQTKWTNPQVSQREQFIPGTHNRVVTCTGPPQASHTAQFLIQQRIQMAQQQQHMQQQHIHQQRMQQQAAYRSQVAYRS